ncbi:dihydrolipoyl dehydrogenase [Paenibacillus marchantiophytorum]|uniref:Dihydrolipoyl dehydrogenase n=1 Tax=Paenibacillus marchantiophytorum TaxID=1619310 RepID=A0ABQ1F3W4_9BACL|nr:dihydrolipoyl dehydrogenase [Paenibacillus marchantiophytorum]GFZ99261.1 dihydrolipoyl dehydrogenase [Paenibacillus marchantiophytorum]
MSEHRYDVVVLGGGIGGYTAAIRAAQLGKTVAVVEREKLGGTCLHQGCIPSKALLRSAEVFATMQKSEEYGITAESVELKFDLVLARKERIVDQLHQGLQFLMKKNKITVHAGNGRIIGPSIFSPRSGAVSVEKEDGDIETLLSSNLIIATGSRPRSLPGLTIDGTHILTSEDALRMEELPKSIIIVGGGVIGVEWASMLHDFGVKVTIVELDKRLVALEDADISKELERLFKKRGINLVTGAKVIAESVKIEAGSVTLQADKQGEIVELKADKVLVSVGRMANVEGIGLENTDIKIDKGVIRVNSFMQTSESHIYAVGDVIGGLMLAHMAGHEGILAAEHIAGQTPHELQTHLVSKCTYTRPEIANVGWTQQQAIDLGHKVKVGKFSFKAIGKALVYGDTDGFVKVIADSETNDILGVHMIGPSVTNSITEAALAQVLNATPWEVGQTIHPHPTLSEALGEAMLAVDGIAISG